MLLVKDERIHLILISSFVHVSIHQWHRVVWLVIDRADFYLDKTHYLCWSCAWDPLLEGEHLVRPKEASSIAHWEQDQSLRKRPEDSNKTVSVRAEIFTVCLIYDCGFPWLWVWDDVDGLGLCQHRGFGPSQTTRAKGNDRDRVQETVTGNSVIPGLEVNPIHTGGSFKTAFCLGLPFLVGLTWIFYRVIFC